MELSLARGSSQIIMLPCKLFLHGAKIHIPNASAFMLDTLPAEASS